MNKLLAADEFLIDEVAHWTLSYPARWFGLTLKGAAKFSLAAWFAYAVCADTFWYPSVSMIAVDFFLLFSFNILFHQIPGSGQTDILNPLRERLRTVRVFQAVIVSAVLFLLLASDVGVAFVTADRYRIIMVQNLLLVISLYIASGQPLPPMTRHDALSVVPG